MADANNSVLALVELANEESDDIRSQTMNNVLNGAFGDRLNDWVRPKDEWSFIRKNRACVILSGIKGRGDLELAGAKLARVFNAPHHYLGKPMPLQVTAGFTAINDSHNDMALAMQQAGIALSKARQSANLFEVYSPKTAKSLEEHSKLL